jgi:hypothetical protein
MDYETEVNELLGLFDAPAFARRGVDLEYRIARLHDRCRAARDERLEMVRMRLRQWASSVPGADAWTDCFRTPIDDLWERCAAEPPEWTDRPASLRRRRAVARDLVASILRFNHRWAQFVSALKLDLVNQTIDHYNRFYTLEKECVMGSARLAARHFVPIPPVTRESLLADYPLLPLPELVK